LGDTSLRQKGENVWRISHSGEWEGKKERPAREERAFEGKTRLEMTGRAGKTKKKKDSADHRDQKARRKHRGNHHVGNTRQPFIVGKEKKSRVARGSRKNALATGTHKPPACPQAQKSVSNGPILTIGGEKTQPRKASDKQKKCRTYRGEGSVSPSLAQIAKRQRTAKEHRSTEE